MLEALNETARGFREARVPVGTREDYITALIADLDAVKTGGVVRD